MKELKILYLFIFALSVTIIALTHIFPPPSFMALRFPHYLEMMGPFLGVRWPLSFEIYHYVLYILFFVGSQNTLAIIFYPRLRKTAIVSSLIGLILIPLMVLFFFSIFISVNVSTAIIYGLYSVVLLIIDWITFKALIIRQKEASRE